MVLFMFLTIGNYSFLRYTIGGDAVSSPIFSAISILRLVIPIWVIVAAFRIHYRLTVSILKSHIDICFLGLAWLLSCLKSLDPSSFLLYGVWTFASLLGILILVVYVAILLNQNRLPIHAYMNRMLDYFWWGNLVVLILGIASIVISTPGSGPYNLLFTSGTFWAYSVLIIGIVAIIKLKYSLATSSVSVNSIFYIVVFIFSVYLIYASGRRSALLVLLLAPLLVYIPFKGSYYILLIALLLFLKITWTPSTTLEVVRLLPENTYTRFRVEVLLGIKKQVKEGSYKSRQEIWNIYLDSFTKNPILGAGLAANERITGEVETKFKNFSAHNTFIGMLAETGMFGFLLWLIVFLNSLRLLLPFANYRPFIQQYILLLVPTFLINWVEYNLIPGQIFFLFTFVVWILPRGLMYLSPLQKTRA